MKFSDATVEQIRQIAEEFPSQLVVMMYDDAIDGLEVAAAAIDAGDVEARYTASVRVTEMLSHLCLGLDLEAGGEIAANLAALYRHGIQQMTDINFTNDRSVPDALRQVLIPLRDAWAELDERIQSDVAEAEAMFIDPAATAKAAPGKLHLALVGA